MVSASSFKEKSECKDRPKRVMESYCSWTMFSVVLWGKAATEVDWEWAETLSLFFLYFFLTTFIEEFTAKVPCKERTKVLVPRPKAAQRNTSSNFLLNGPIKAAPATRVNILRHGRYYWNIIQKPGRSPKTLSTQYYINPPCTLIVRTTLLTHQFYPTKTGYGIFVLYILHILQYIAHYIYLLFIVSLMLCCCDKCISLWGWIKFNLIERSFKWLSFFFSFF